MSACSLEKGFGEGMRIGFTPQKGASLGATPMGAGGGSCGKFGPGRGRGSE